MRVRSAFLLALPILISAASLSAAALPFIEDDYPRALAESRSRKLPIFVEAWAPW